MLRRRSSGKKPVQGSVFWLKDKSLEDSASLPDPDILAADRYRVADTAGWMESRGNFNAPGQEELLTSHGRGRHAAGSRASRTRK